MGCGGRKSQPIPAGGAVGDILVWDGAAWIATAPPLQTFVYSATSLLSPNCFLPARDGNGNALSTDTGGGYLANAGDSVRELVIEHGVAAGADPVVYTILVNGVASGASVALSSGVAGFARATVNVALAANDLVTVAVSGLTANRIVNAILLVGIRKAA